MERNFPFFLVSLICFYFLFFTFFVLGEGARDIFF